MEDEADVVRGDFIQEEVADRSQQVGEHQVVTTLMAVMILFLFLQFNFKY